jgi:dynein heavy chain
MMLHFTEEGGGKNGRQAHGDSSVADGSAASQQQQDWSLVWEYFDNPHKLLVQPGGGLSKVMQDMVRNAVAGMRRYYSRKVVDVLIKVTRHSLDCLRKRFTSDSDATGSFHVNWL